MLSLLSQGVERNRFAGLHVLDQAEDFLCSSPWPHFLSKEFEPLEVDGLLAFVKRVSDHPLEVENVLSPLSRIPGWRKHGSILIRQGLLQGRNPIPQSFFLV